MKNFLTLKFWFNLRPDQLLPVFQKTFVGFILFFVIFSLICRFFGFKKRGIYAPIWRRLYSFSLTNVFVGLFLLFFNYEMIPFLSARFWFLLWAVIMVIWLVFVAKNLLKIPEKKKKIEEENKYQKYIP